MEEAIATPWSAFEVRIERYESRCCRVTVAGTVHHKDQYMFREPVLFQTFMEFLGEIFSGVSRVEAIDVSDAISA
ncbi:hypothetical protein C8R44DRAFT_825558 [Mycena epipterygia]|nr:hypothetical protein C8R44DRAFT_825558 [Mycena epipterygia]